MKQLIENTWEEDFEKWIKELQAKRDKETEKCNGQPDLTSELFFRNWAQINGQFTYNFFELLDKVKAIDIDLYNQYVENANGTILFFHLDK